MRPQPGGGAGDGRQTGRISRATEASGTRPCTTCGARAEGAAGPQRAHAPHRGHGEGLRGSEARTGACRSEDERGWSTVRKGSRGAECSLRNGVAAVTRPGGLRPAGATGKKRFFFAVLTPGCRSPQSAIAGAKAERPFPERSPARSADGGSPESDAPAVDSGEPEAERKGLDGARIKAKGVRSGDSDSGPSGQGRPATVSREERRRSGAGPEHIQFTGRRRPPILLGDVRLPTESRRRAWRQPRLSGEAETANPFNERRKAPGRRCPYGGGAPAETPEEQQPERSRTERRTVMKR